MRHIPDSWTRPVVLATLTSLAVYALVQPSEGWLAALLAVVVLGRHVIFGFVHQALKGQWPRRHQY